MREIDRLVAEKVMGFKIDRGESHYDGSVLPWEIWIDENGKKHNPIEYSSNIKDAWIVVEKMNKYGDFTLYKDCDSSKWIAELALSTIEIYGATEESVPMTICKLALNSFK